jgi:pyruvate dehydrogenase E1 component alpha subunit
MKNFSHMSSLGNLADPACVLGPCNIMGHSKKQLTSDLATMIRIRIVEERIGQLAVDQIIKTPIHLAIGQEAVAVGVSRHLRSSDRVFGGHRSHSHYLALGGNLGGLLAEILCRETGVAGGRGGSMHLIDQSVGFSGSVPLVGATIPLGVGAALAAKFDGAGDIGVSYFGDGACEEGVLHESLNLAMVQHLPILFVAENNLYSSHLDIKLRQPDDKVSRYAEAHRMRQEVVDGNDLTAVISAAKRLIDSARAGEGPGFLEAITYRWRGHVGPDENIDVGVRRSAKEVAAWRGRDPIARLRDALIESGSFSYADFSTIEGTESERIEAAISTALLDNFPTADKILDHVYSV